MEYFKRYLTERGLKTTDIPAAIVVHEFVGLGVAVASWALCYAVQPSKTFMQPLISRGAKIVALKRGCDTAMSSAQVTSGPRSSPKLEHYRKLSSDFEKTYHP